MRFLSPLLVILFASSSVIAAEGDGFLLDDQQIEELMRVDDGESAVAAKPAPAAGQAGAQDVRWRIELHDGQMLRGRLVSQSRDEVVLELSPGARMTLSRAAIREMVVDRGNAHPTAGAKPAVATKPAATQTASASVPHPDAGAKDVAAPAGQPVQGERAWFADPNRTRGLYVPSAMMLRQGEGSVSQKELFFTSFNYGLTDWLSVQIGGIVPVWFVDGGFNLIGGAKVGGKVLDFLHLSAGAQTLVLAPAGVFGGVGFGYGNATFGNENLHATLTVGVPWTAGVEFGMIGDLIVVASGNLRVTEHVAFVTENWIFPTSIGKPDSFTHILSLAVRLMNQNLSADIGFLAVPYVPFPVPWLSGTWNFQL